MKRKNLIGLLLAGMASLAMAMADVNVVFTNSLSARENNVPVLLEFSVDGSGHVGLAASTTSSDAEAIAAVSNWSGGVGTLGDSNAWNSVFSLSISALKQSGSGKVTLSEVGAGGIAIQGQSSSRIDGGGLASPNVETLRIIAAAGAAKVKFKSLSWNSSGDNIKMTAATGGASATNSIGSAPGTWTLSGTGTNFVMATGESLNLSTASANGYALAGFSFDLILPEVEPRTNALPNIVVIVADDLGYSDISYNPFHAPEVSTPNIDRLIRNGVWFSDAYASGNICAPSRAGFMAGVYQHRLGVHREQDVNSSDFPSSYPIFPQHLKQQFDGIEDYSAKMVGKWHMGRDRGATVDVDANTNGVFADFEFDYGNTLPETMRYHPMTRGFDECYGFVNLGGNSYWDYGQGFFDQFYRFEPETPIDGAGDGDALETYLTTRFTEEAVDFIGERSASNKPFYLHLSYNAVHTPMHAPASPAGLSEGDPGWYPDAAWFDANFPDMWKTPDYSKSNGQVEDQATRAILMAMLYHMDQGIGEVVDALKTNGVWENTIVVFWSDNGGASASRAANAPLRERKHFNYEGGVRVPMSISWPAGLGTYSNTTVSAPVISFDILPTVLEAVEIEPLNGFDSFDGKSLLPLIRGEVDQVHERLCWSEGGDSGEYSIRQGDWKLYIDQDVYELYNLAADIGESNELSDTYPDQVCSMRQAFFAWMSEMVEAAGDDIDVRLWGTTSAPDPGTPAIELQGIQVSDGVFGIEYDERVGWLTNGPVYEATDSLTNSWAPVAPNSLEQLDRWLDQSTYRVTFPVDEPKRFFRIRGE